MKPLNIETILGHDAGITGSSYYSPTESELLDDYLKAADVLTINHVNKLQRDIQKIKARNEQLKTSRTEVEQLRLELELLLALKEVLKKGGILRTSRRVMGR